MPQQPMISVIMPVHNQRAFVGEALRSVLEQTLADFEVLVVDDGSTDDSASIVKRFSDARIRLDCQAHRGLVCSLNRAISLARAPLLARMDADDVAETTRFEEQYRFLNEHPEVGVLGTSYVTIDRDGREIERFAMPETDALIKLELLVDNPFCHPSVMMRREVVETVGAYREEAQFVEDYDLWLRASRDFKFHNLQAFLLKYRINPQGVTGLNRTRQLELQARLSESAFRTVLALEPEVLEQLRTDAMNLGSAGPRNTRKRTRKIASLYSFRLAYRLMKENRLRSAGRWFATAFRLYPENKIRLLSGAVRYPGQSWRRSR